MKTVTIELTEEELEAAIILVELALDATIDMPLDEHEQSALAKFRAAKPKEPT